MMNQTLIIGSGYLGEFIKNALPEAISSSLDQSGDFYFDLNSSDFYKLPKADNLIITCSTENMNSKAKIFADFAKEQYKKVIIISTASLFDVPYPNAIIDESSPLKSNHPRTQSESYFTDFATILYLGLLWDKSYRRPEKWFSNIKNGNKYINLCNSELVAKVCQKLINENKSLSGKFICTDGPALLWKNLPGAESFNFPEKEIGLESKILNSKKLQFTLKSKIDWECYVYN